MIQNRDYLKDIPFLMELTRERNKEIYVKAVSLDFQTETEIGEVEGLIISGNFSVDGSSAVRRTGSLSIFCNISLYDNDPLARDINYYKQFFGLSKKVDIEIGLINNFNSNYPEKIWFQMGRYIITNATFSNNISGGITININIGDKMNLLNGYCGGTISSSTEVDKIIDNDANGKTYTRRASIYEMLLEMVNHLGGEQLGKILISDLETTTKTGLRIKEDSKKKYYLDQENNKIVIKEYIDGESPKDVNTFAAGDFIGYKSIDYTYPTKDYFTLNNGDTVVTGLDKIRSNIGNYEYFYDLNGNFRWQEIRDYRNTSKATMDLKNLSNDDYLVDRDNGNALYDFENSDIITSYSNNPQYSNLKNDFVIWGSRTVGEGNNKKTFPIRYHLAIDDKPYVPSEYSEEYLYLILEDIDDNGKLKYKAPVIYDQIEQLPSIGKEGAIYFIQNTGEIYKYNASENSGYIKLFSQEQKNPTLNQKQFYEAYSQLKAQANYVIDEARTKCAKLSNKYLEIQNEIKKIVTFLNDRWFLDKRLNNISKSFSEFISSIENEINNDFLSLTEDAHLLAQDIIDQNFFDEEQNSYQLYLEKDFKKLNYLLKNFSTSRFRVGLTRVELNLNNFEDDFLNFYEAEYKDTLNKYYNLLKQYYNYFLEYEIAEGQSNTLKMKEIADAANKLFLFSPIDILSLLDSLNEVPPTYDTITNDERIINKRVKLAKEILKDMGIIKDSVSKEDIFFLNEDYKIGETSLSANDFYEYINKLNKLIFDNNLLDIFMKLFNRQFDTLVNIYLAAFQEKWSNSGLAAEINTVEQKITEGNLITSLAPLKSMTDLLSDTLGQLKIYYNKSSFPSENENDDFSYMDGEDGTIYMQAAKIGYYIATGISSVKYIFPQNWRTMIFLQNLDSFASENNIYSNELQEEWGKLFDLVPYLDKNNQTLYKNDYIIYTDKIKDSVYTKPDLLDYWLDFIDSKTMDFNELKISNIGRRTLVQKNEKVNCIFAPDIPDYLIIEDSLENKELIKKLDAQGRSYILVSKDFLNECDSNGLTLYSAFDSISNTLYNYLGFNNTINLTCLPMFFLEPNIRIKLRDEASDIYGDYLIKSFSISLNNLSTMNITCTKVIDSI